MEITLTAARMPYSVDGIYDIAMSRMSHINIKMCYLDYYGSIMWGYPSLTEHRQRALVSYAKDVKP